MFSLAVALWPLGEVDRAVSLVEQMLTRIADLTYVGTLAVGRMYAALFELMRGDGTRAAPNAFELARLAREHELTMFGAVGAFLGGWVTAAGGAPGGGLEAMRRGVDELREQKVLIFDGLIKITLAEAEARAGDPDRVIAILDEALATSDRTGYRAFEAELHRARGEILLKRDAANPAPAEEAYLTAIAVAKQQATRSFELRAALPLAKLYRLTGRPADAHAILAPALEGFSPTPEMPEIAEAQALLAALTETDEVKAEMARRERRFKLESRFAQAVGWSKGFAAEEAKVAADRVAHALATGSGTDAEQLAAHQPLWATSFMRGETASAREAAEDFLRAAESARSLPWEAAARRSMGATLLLQADLAAASKFLEEAMDLADRGGDGDRMVGTGPDPGASAATHLSLASWMLGDLDRSHRLIEEAFARAEGIEHSPTLTVVRYFAALREMLCGDARATLPLALSLIDFCRDRAVEQFLDAGMAIAAWARARVEDLNGGVLQFRQALAALSEQGNKVYLPLYLGRLAEIELAEQGPDAALSRIEQAQVLAQDTGQRIFDAFLERLHGEALLAADPADASAAESAFLKSLELSRRQNARSFGLQAALALAKLYQSTGRPVEAHAVLAPALEGFSPTPEMPEIAEAQALLAAIEESGGFRAEAAQRQRRLHLQVAYGNALIAARGYGAPETTEAFARARDWAYGDKAERLAVDYGLWVGSYVRGELPPMRAHAEAFLNDVAATPDSPDAGVAHRIAGVTHWFAGEFVEAKDELERALALFQPGRDDELAFRFGHDAGVCGMAYLAHASWALGDIGRAVSVFERMQTRIAQVEHVGSRALGAAESAIFNLMRGDRTRAVPNILELARLAREHGLTLFLAVAEFLEGWATSESDVSGGLEAMRFSAELLKERGVLIFDGLLKITLARAEARAGDRARAVAIIDEALETCDRTGYRAYEAELHRARGEVLLQRDSANPAPSEEAFQTAIAVAREQGARAFGLRAALWLAKLYQSTSCPAEAHAVLASALEGFAPTPEMPEIAEAQVLLAALAETEEVKADQAQRRRMTQLQAAYGAALIAARGFGAPETTEAFARARESAAGDDSLQRLAGDYGLWASSYVRGDLPAMKAQTAVFLADVAAKPDSGEAGIAHRVQGMTHLFAGEFVEAARELELALARFEPGRDDDLAVRFPPDPGAAAMIYLAFASWALGEFGQAASLIERMRARVEGLSHATTLAHATALTAFFALMRGDRSQAGTSVSELARIVRDHELPLFRAIGEFLVGWADAEGGALAEGLAAMRRGVREPARAERRGVRRDHQDRARRGRGARRRSGTRAGPSRRSFGDVRAHGLPRVRMRASSGARGYPAQVRSDEPRPGRRRLQDRHRPCEATGRARLSAARVARARQALPNHQPPFRSPRPPRA